MRLMGLDITERCFSSSSDRMCQGSPRSVNSGERCWGGRRASRAAGGGGWADGGGRVGESDNLSQHRAFVSLVKYFVLLSVFAIVLAKDVPTSMKWTEKPRITLVLWAPDEEIKRRESIPTISRKRFPFMAKVVDYRLCNHSEDFVRIYCDLFKLGAVRI